MTKITRYDSPVNHVGVADDSSNLRVSVTALRPLVDIRATNDGKPIVNDADLPMDVHLLSCEHISAQFPPVTKGENSDIVIRLEPKVNDGSGLLLERTYVDAFLPQSTEDRVGTTTDCSVLTLEDDTDLHTQLSVCEVTSDSCATYRTSITLVNRERETRQQWDNNAALPRCTFSVCSNYAMNDGVSNSVLNLHLVDNGAERKMS